MLLYDNLLWQLFDLRLTFLVHLQEFLLVAYTQQSLGIGIKDLPYARFLAKVGAAWR